MLGVSFTSCSNSNPDAALANETPVANTVNDTPEKELQRLEQSITNDADNVELLVKKAQMLLELGKDESLVLHDLNKALTLDPSYSKTYLVLSDLYFREGKFERSKKSLMKYVKMDPSDMNGKLKLVEINMMIGDFQSALILSREAIGTNQENPKAYYLFGYTCKLAGDTASAIKALKKSLEFEPEYADALLQLGILYKEKNNPLGNSFLDEAVRCAENTPVAYFTRGWYEQESGKFDEAISDYNHALDIDPNFVDAMYNKGYIQLVEKENMQEAIYVFTNLLSISPNNVKALCNRGRAFEAKEDYVKAKQDYRRALDIDPEFKLAKEGLNRANSRLGFI